MIDSESAKRDEDSRPRDAARHDGARLLFVVWPMSHNQPLFVLRLPSKLTQELTRSHGEKYESMLSPQIQRGTISR